MSFSLFVGVGSSKSGAGKTTFIENFIKFIKKLYKEAFVVAIKCTKTSIYSSIITESSIINTEGKDTDRMKKAGADLVYWIKARDEDLHEIAKKLKEEILRFTQNDKKTNFVLIEGNSLVRAMLPDVIIFFKDRDEKSVKPSGEAVLKKADIVIDGNYSMEEIMREIDIMTQKKLIEKLLIEKSNNGKITCSEARKIAEELNVGYIEVGKMANELNIKIRKCELGCF
ncbi:MAG: molybdopterin-guanine dinucleotide biosynthesis protein MobB [Thermodesulfovibrio sp.]|nr:molybdopterin-guanine dinucleotide biosynthesis protein MobB [Thermodesulfovibrio sp.]MDW7999200.1 molybdopterin-guanine dinucleotide biosynthesis protein MobB [Thermodesulfovibrio sp.]